MQARTVLSVILKGWVLAMIAVALIFLYLDRAVPPLASDVEAAEQPKNTNVEVRIGAIRKMPLREYIVSFGNVEPEPATANSPAADAKLTVDWPAVVTDVHCVEGQAVKRGDLLLVSKVPINSPIDGSVVAVNIHPGEIALPTSTAIEVVDLDRLVVAANVPASQAGKLSLGQKAHVQLPDRNTEFDGSIQRIDHAADPANSLVSVDISVPKSSNLRPGQFARVSIVSDENAEALVVPADAIVRDSQDIPYIALVSDDHKQAVLKQITPGIREGDWVQVTADGLAADQTIVTGGAYALLFYKAGITVLNP